MKKLSQILEGRMSGSALSKLQKEITEYNEKIKGKVPQEVSDASEIIDRYKIYDPEVVKRIVTASKSEQKRIADEYGMSATDSERLFFLVRKIEKDGNLRLIPVMMSKNEREAFEAGRMALDDLTMDLETKAGRDAVAKLYAPLVMKIASQFEGRCNFDKDDLIGSGMVGLTNAMNNYRKPETTDIDSLEIEDSDKREGQKLKTLSFKKYAAWRIRFQILSDINRLSRTVRIPQTRYEKLRDEGRVGDTFVGSIDAGQDGEEGSTTDRIPDLGHEPEVYRRDTSKQDEKLQELYKAIEKKFGLRDSMVFFKLFGVNNQQKVSARTIAAELKVKEERISQIKHDIILYLRENAKKLPAVRELRDMLIESILVAMYDRPKNEIYEALIGDDVLMILEAITKWDSKDKLSRSISTALESMADTTKADYIVHCLRDGFDYIDSTYRKNKLVIMEFLSIVEPTETFGKRSDAFIIERMSEMADLCKKYGMYNNIR